MQIFFARKGWLQSQNEKKKKKKSQAPLRNQFITRLLPCLRRTSLKWSVFSCGKQPGSMLVFAFSLENLILMQLLRTKSLKKSYFLSVTLIIWMYFSKTRKPCWAKHFFRSFWSFGLIGSQYNVYDQMCWTKHTLYPVTFNMRTQHPITTTTQRRGCVCSIWESCPVAA